MNKKGQAENFFDYLFTAGIALGLLLVLWFFFDQNTDNTKKASLSALGEFHQRDSAINNLRSSIMAGEEYDPAQLDTLIANSQVLGGRVITTCRDYYTQTDCDEDRVNLHPDAAESCLWVEAEGLCKYVIEELSLPVAVGIN